MCDQRYDCVLWFEPFFFFWFWFVGDLYCAVRSYSTKKHDEVSVPIGSVVEVLRKSDDGWWLIRYPNSPVCHDSNKGIRKLGVLTMPYSVKKENEIVE